MVRSLFQLCHMWPESSSVDRTYGPSGSYVIAPCQVKKRPMKIGIMADIHDNVDNLRHAIGRFNAEGCSLVLLAGDFVSPLVVPSMRKLTGKVVACFGDNDGNQRGIIGGMEIVGTLGYGPFSHQTSDGLKILMAHQLNDVKDCIGDEEIIVFAHTHRPSVVKDRKDRLFINPGEVGGWMFRKPTVVILDTESRQADVVNLPQMSPGVFIPEPG
jgi:putative phosphoesterase